MGYVGGKRPFPSQFYGGIYPDNKKARKAGLFITDENLANSGILRPNNPFTNGVLHQIRPRVQIQFLHNIFTVAGHGFGGNR